MPNSNLATYLNDHLAGSVAAIEMMEHLEKLHAGSKVAHVIAGLRGDVLEDRDALEGLMKQLSIAISTPRKVIAWLSEKLAEVKLGVDDRTGGPFHLLEAVEMIAIGIHGKAGLWRALATVRFPVIAEIDLKRLERRAVQQRDLIETLRLDAATIALQEPT